MIDFGDIFAYGLSTVVFVWGSIAMIAILAIAAMIVSKRIARSQSVGMHMYPSSAARTARL